MRGRSFGTSDGRRPFGSGSVIAIIVITVVIAGIWFYRQSPDLGAAEGSLLVNINTATTVQLETLPGIGPALADMVIAGRPYVAVADLARVRGISKQQVERLRSVLTVSEDTRRVDGSSTAKKWLGKVTHLDYATVIGFAMTVVAAIYYGLPLWRSWRLRRQNARTLRLAAEAERRKWEGHRRE